MNAQKRPIKTVRYLDLSNNYLGYSDAGTAPYTQKSDWCPTTWEPTTVDTAVAGSLETLDISSNALPGELSARPRVACSRPPALRLPGPTRARCAVARGRRRRLPSPVAVPAPLATHHTLALFPLPAGALPTNWPQLFPKLQYLVVYGNNLQAAATAQPGPLPGTWAAGVQRGFPLLKELVLYPGNENLCSVPTNDGGFRDVNLGERGRHRPGSLAGLGWARPALQALPCCPCPPASLPACLPACGAHLGG